MQSKLSASVILTIVLMALVACNLQGNSGTGTTQEVDPPEATTTSFTLMVTVSEAVEYRTGPGEVYELVGVLDPGQEVEAVGRSPDGEYLLFRISADPLMLYWMKSEFATVSGNPIGLPVATPVSTPTSVGGPGPVSGCPSPVPSGPTPLSCSAPPPNVGCPSPVPSGPTPLSCSGPPPVSGCPSPVGGGPTPLPPCNAPPPNVGCPSPVGGGPTPLPPCSGPPPVSSCPTLVTGGPTLVYCPTSVP